MTSSSSRTSLATVRSRTEAVQCGAKRNLLLAFVDEESNRVKASTLNARLDPLIPLAAHLGARPWKNTTRQDVIHVIATHQSRRGNRLGENKAEGLASTTKYQWSIQIRVFFKWLLDTDETPPQCRRLPFRKIDVMASRIQELALTPQEVRQLLSGASHKRDRAIIITAIEGGFRASELAALRLDYTTKRKHGYWLNLPPDEPDLKTGPREVDVPIIAGRSFIDEWLMEHPRRHDSKAPLFVTISNRSYGKRMTGASVAAVIARAAKRAGLRHVHAHMLRHTSTSLKVAKHMDPEAVRLIHGWTKRSTMMTYYTHVKPQFESMILDIHGLEDDEPALLDIIGSQPCLLCGAKLHVADAECTSCSATNSGAYQQGQVERNRDAAIGYVAADLAKALGWNGTEGAGPIGFLEGEYHRNQDADPQGDGFVQWCLIEWVRCCRPDGP